MISEALSFLVSEVNTYLDARLGAGTAARVSLGNIAKATDSEGNTGNNNAGSGMAMLTLISIEEEKAARNPENFRRIDDRVIYRNPPVPVNLYALFSAHTTSYSTALEIISHIIQCFQAQRTFQSDTNPNLNPAIGKLNVDLYNLTFEQLNHLWSTLGGKYLPSVLYKVRLVRLEDPNDLGTGEVIREIGFNGRNKTLSQ